MNKPLEIIKLFFPARVDLLVISMFFRILNTKFLKSVNLFDCLNYWRFPVERESMCIKLQEAPFADIKISLLIFWQSWTIYPCRYNKSLTFAILCAIWNKMMELNTGIKKGICSYLLFMWCSIIEKMSQIVQTLHLNMFSMIKN